MPDLATLQRSLWASVVGGADASALVVGSPSVPAGDRLAVYARAYLARLLGCLRDEFALLRAMVGDQVFDLFARGYLAACPPRSPTMHDLGDRFAEHLEATRPSPADDPAGLGALPAELARLDRARAESRRAAGVEGEPAAELDLAVLLVRPRLRLRTPPSTQLLACAFDLLTVVDAVARDVRPVPPPAATPTWIAVTRARYRVGVHRLSPSQHAFLERCGPDGAEFADAAAHAAAGAGITPAAAWVDLAAWLPAAVGAGLAVADAGH